MRRGYAVFGMTVLLAFAVIAAAPIVFLVTGSLMGDVEIREYLSPVLTGAKGYASWRLFPVYPTLKNVVELLLDSPEFFLMFWNTMKIAAGILLGQIVLALPAAWGLSRGNFPGKRFVYGLYILLMMMPFQVMMLSQYLVLKGMGLDNTLWAVILPGSFSTFSVFLMYRFFTEIPEEVIEAARIDGAGEWKIFLFIGAPLGRTGVTAALLLQFLEAYGMVEQPLAFLKEKSLFPLSLYLPEISLEEAGFAFCASLVALLPVLFLFLAGSKELGEGIASSAWKE